MDLEMKVDCLDEDTVVSFEYFYTPAKDNETVLLIQALVGPDQYIYKRTFGKEKLTLDRLRIGHMQCQPFVFPPSRRRAR